MDSVNIRKLVINGMMIALVFLVTKFAGFTAPFGYFNLGDAVVMSTAILFGSKTGLVAGAFGSALSDALTPGYLAFAPITFIVKGMEGYVVGLIANSGSEKNNTIKIAAVAAGACVMIAGYFLGEVLILGAFDKTYSFAYAINELVSTNILQGSICAVIGYILSTVLAKSTTLLQN